MSTSTNGIATFMDIGGLTKECVTKADLPYNNYDLKSNPSHTYTDKQLVKYSDLEFTAVAVSIRVTQRFSLSSQYDGNQCFLTATDSNGNGYTSDYGIIEAQTINEHYVINIPSGVTIVRLNLHIDGLGQGGNMTGSKTISDSSNSISARTGTSFTSTGSFS